MKNLGDLLSETLELQKRLMPTTAQEEVEIQKIMGKVVLWREGAARKLGWRIAEYLREHQFAKAVAGSDKAALKVKRFFAKAQRKKKR